MRLALVSLLALVLVPAAVSTADAQSRRVVRQGGDVVVLTVRPRSFLDSGRVAPVGSLNRYASSQIAQYVNSPPYHHQRDLYGHGNLPDAIHGTFVGGRNPFPNF